jgi:hypothetical protein
MTVKVPRKWRTGKIQSIDSDVSLKLKENTSFERPSKIYISRG